MKAYILYGVNNLRYEDRDRPQCPEGWAVVKVKAAGICSSDIARIFTKGTYHFPTIPGHEFAGIIDSVGAEKDKDLLGRHTGVFPLIPCRECEPCKEQHYEMCNHYDYLGSRRDGGFAEYVVVPVWNLIPLSVDIPFVSAAMLEPLAVALHAAKIGNIQAGQNVGVIGAGMIGICVAQWAKSLDANKVEVIGRNENKRNFVVQAGLDYVIETSKEKIGQYDVVIEAVGSPIAIDLAIHAVKPGGTLVLMGNPSSDITLQQNSYWRILRKQLVVKGIWNSSYDGMALSDWTEAVSALEQKKIKVGHLISNVYNQEHLSDGLELMLWHKKPYCKVMTIWNE